MANIDAYDNRLNKCLDLAASSPSNQFDIRQQLFNAFSSGNANNISPDKKDEADYFMEKRRGGVNTNNNALNLDSSKYISNDVKNMNSIVHIRQTWDPSHKITPNSSMRTSEFSKLNRYDDSEYSSDKTIKESFNKLQRNSLNIKSFSSNTSP